MQANEIAIENWPFTEDFRNADSFTQKLYCPSLTELNLIKKKSEASLLKSVYHKGNTWILTWPKSLSWWDDEAVTDNDKIIFLRESLSKYGKFSIESKSNQSILVWKKTPKVGPYILNNLPLRKKTSSELGFVCAGEYQLISLSKNLLKLKRDKTVLTFSTERINNNRKNIVSFILGSEFSNTPWTRLPDKKINCKKSMSLPIVSLIDWDIDRYPSNKKEFRIASTNLLPRGNILRAGSAYMGSLVTYPNLKAHPGYNRSLKIRPYNIPRAKKGLTRFLKQKIYLKAESSSPYIKKTIEEHFHLAGLEVEWTESSNSHGSLKSLFLPWPQLALNKNDSKESNKYNKLMREYKNSLSFERPKFSLLRKAQAQAYNEELFTVLHSHRACVKWSKNNRDQSLPKLILRDPNWLSKLVTNIKKKGA